MNSYRIRVSVSNCRYVIKLNDFVYFEDKVGLQLDTEACFNEIITKNSALLSVELYPIQGRPFLDDTVFCKCEILSQADFNGSSSSAIHHYQFDQHAKKMEKHSYTHQLALKNSYENKVVFEQAETVDLSKALIAQVIETSHSFWSMFQDQRIDLIRNFIVTRERIYSESYKLDYDDRIESTLSIYRNHMTNDGQKLFKFLPKYYSPKVHCFGKLISLQDEDGFHPIFYLKNQRDGCVNIPAYFAKINGEVRLVL